MLEERINQIRQDRENQRAADRGRCRRTTRLSPTDKLIAQGQAQSVIQSGQTLEFQLSQQLLDAQSQLASIDLQRGARG